ncbi:lytic polysaccharide monooxygenase [Lentithecium fluviatile CBS 122367]|uniref:Lytic polysaccharide monooxygenase n=1 Tax=Lentithecium fluviatile CBS 122367 TaxID=1168545 RepID=A0A6G1IU27_9PLEO|nr:lytic polysaccharide monooxygenase [Lentithecium fluviatile CBS 122367]
MHPCTLLLAGLAAIVDLTSAHGFVTGIRVNGIFFKGFDPDWGFTPVSAAESKPVPVGWTAKNIDIGFVAPDAFQTPHINCHKNSTAAKAYATANPGDTIEFVWNQWIDTHKGPILNYIAPCDGDCTTLTPSALHWTKFSQDGLITPGGQGYWITDALIENNFTASASLPKNLKPGNYVLRHEIIALHGAREDNGAQSYPQCLNVRVGGSGRVALGEGIPGTKLYNRTEPGMRFNLYDNPTRYLFPGPPVWTAAD